MKKINKNNLFMYALIVIAVLMLSTTLTMAVLSDNKKGKEDLVFGRVAISGENSCLEFVIDEPITQDSEILNDERYLYFSPTDDTEPMIVRLKVEYQIDEAGYDEQIEILNSTIADDNYFVPYSNSDYEGGYSYIYDEGYFYLVMYNASSVELDTMFEIWAEDSEHQFIICDEYIFHLADKASQASVFTNLVSKNLKLVVTIEAAQKEGLESLSDVWEMPEGEVINIGYYDGESYYPYTTARTDSNGNLTLPTSVPAGYSGQEISFYYDNDKSYAPGSTVNMSDIIPYEEDCPFIVQFAGLYGEVESVSGSPVGIASEEDYTWQEVLEMGIFTVNNGVLSEGTKQYRVSGTAYLDLPYNITTIKSSAFNQSYDGNLLLQLTGLTLPGNLITLEDTDYQFTRRLQHLTMFDNVQNMGLFNCDGLVNNGMTLEKGIYYVGSGNNPYMLAESASYNENYDPTDENNNWGYNFPTGTFEINQNTKIVSLNTLISYINLNMQTKANPFDTESDDMTFVAPANYEISDLASMQDLYALIRSNDTLFMQGPFMRAPFLTHENGIIYLKKGNNAHYAVVYAYAGMNIPKEVANTPADLVFDGIEQDDVITLDSNTQIILPGAFSCVYKYTLTDTPVSFSLTLGSAFTKIEDGTFANTTITSVTLPNTLTYIGNCAFEGCKLLTSVTIPASVEYIGYYAFANTGITSFTVANGNTHYSTLDSGKYLVKTSGNVLIQYALGDSATSITNMPNTIRSIAVGAFVGCLNLEELIIPSTIETVAYLNQNNQPFTINEYNMPMLFKLAKNNGCIKIDSQDFYDAYVGDNFIVPADPQDYNEMTYYPHCYDLSDSTDEDVRLYVYINKTLDNHELSSIILDRTMDGGYNENMSDNDYYCYAFPYPAR